jgi:hypothetical protein
MADVVTAHAAHLLPDLDAVARAFRANPGRVLTQAFGNADAGRRPRAIVGPGAPARPAPFDPGSAAMQAERRRLVEIGSDALDRLRSEGPAAALSDEAQLGIEAIVSIARPALLLQDGTFDDPPPPWNEILGSHRGSIRTSALSVGRIGVRGLPQLQYAGTGFLVADEVVMTNCHVARVFAELGSDGNWSFQPNLEVSLDLREDPDAPPSQSSTVGAAAIREVIGIHPALDLALLRVEPRDGWPGAARPLTVMSGDPGQTAGRHVYVLGYPAPDYRNDPTVQRTIFGDRYFVKRLQPGAVMAPPARATIRMEPCSTGADPEDVVFHDASTLGGNSGSCVIDLDSHRVIGLHFAGRYLHYNEALALWRLADDPLLVRAGVNFG